MKVVYAKLEQKFEPIKQICANNTKDQDDCVMLVFATPEETAR